MTVRKLRITLDGVAHDVEVEELGADGAPLPVQPEGSAVEETIAAPLPGRVQAIAVRAGQAVRAGDTLLVVEDAQVESEIIAPRDAVVTEIRTVAGASVAAGDILAVIR